MVKDFPAAVKGVFFLKTGYLRDSECRYFHTIQILLDSGTMNSVNLQTCPD